MPKARDKFEDKVAITGIGMSQVGRRLMRDPIALTVEAAKQRDRRRRARPGDDIDGLSTYPGGGDRRWACRKGGITAVEEALRAPAVVDQRRHRDARAGRARSSPRCSRSRAGCAGTCCASAPCGRRRTRQGTRSAQRTRQHRDARCEVPPHRRRHAMAHAVRRVVGGELDRHAGDRCTSPLRHDPRDARLDRAERPHERGAAPVGDLQGTAHDGRLPVGAHDHDAVRSVRLRRPVRRLGGGHRLAQGSSPATCEAAGARRGGGHADHRAR